MSDFDRFQEEVLSAYHEKKEKRLLSIELERPSPTQLMNYCLTLLYSGKLTDDLSTLNRIFNPHNRYPDLETGISAFGASGFKSLRNFMTGKTTRPREALVKLLAVLIDFQPRPYDKWVMERSNPDRRSTNTGETLDEPVDELPPIRDLGQGQMGNTGQGGNGPKEGIWSKLKKPALYGIIAFAGMAGAHQISDSFDRECMYWETDRYIPIACSEKIEGVEIIPLDKEMIKNFRKITRPDTLTLKSVGRVWYGKPTADSAEFYTVKGTYPLNRRKELKPATDYIIKKYVLDKYK